MDSITIQTGEKHIAIKDEKGNVKGEIVFNPYDNLFAEKFYALYGSLDAKVAEYEARAKEIDSHSESDVNGVPLNAADRLGLITDICNDFRKEIDNLFCAGTSQTAFGDVRSFDVIQQLLQGVAPYIQSARAEKIKQYLPQKPPVRSGKGRVRASRKR